MRRRRGSFAVLRMTMPRRHWPQLPVTNYRLLRLQADDPPDHPLRQQPAEEEQHLRVEGPVVTRRGIVARDRLLDEARDVIRHAGDAAHFPGAAAVTLVIGRVRPGL